MSREPLTREEANITVFLLLATFVILSSIGIGLLFGAGWGFLALAGAVLMMVVRVVQVYSKGLRGDEP
jgi:uncharacterized membrane protein YhiD involved in acid resistance